MASHVSPTGDEDIFTKLEHIIQSQPKGMSSMIDSLISLKDPTISVGILDNGKITSKIIHSNSPNSSLPSPEHSNKENDTLFQAASISKSITSLAILKLCQRGILDLDAPISHYLSKEQISLISTTPQTHALASSITLSHLLSHTAGLSCTGFPGYASPPYPRTLDQIIQALPPANNKRIVLSYMPGTTYAYSGGGYIVIQLILETVLRKDFSEIMDELVLGPLNMSKSTFRLLEEGKGEEQRNYATAYWNGSTPCVPTHNAMVESAPAGLWTTPSELLLAVHAVQLGLSSSSSSSSSKAKSSSTQTNDNIPFLERKWATRMLTEIEDNEMGLGWYVTKQGNNFQHAGSNFPGYECVVVGYADLGFSDTDKESAIQGAEHKEPVGKTAFPKECGICVMTSSGSGAIIHHQLVAAICYLKDWPLISRSETTIPFTLPSSPVPDQAREWCGKWGSTPKIWELNSIDGGFQVVCRNSPTIPLLLGAMPSKVYKEGKGIELVGVGLEVMMRLGWKDGRKVIELCQDGDVAVLERMNS